MITTVFQYPSLNHEMRKAFVRDVQLAIDEVFSEYSSDEDLKALYAPLTAALGGVGELDKTKLQTRKGSVSGVVTRLLGCLNRMDMHGLSDPAEKTGFLEEIEQVTSSLFAVSTERVTIMEIWGLWFGGGRERYFYLEVTLLNDNLARRVLRKYAETENLPSQLLNKLLDENEDNQ